jgi:hypothetical protein
VVAVRLRCGLLVAALARVAVLVLFAVCGTVAVPLVATLAIVAVCGTVAVPLVAALAIVAVCGTVAVRGARTVLS